MVSVTVNQPLILQRHTLYCMIPQQVGMGVGSYYGRQRRLVTIGDWPHTVNVYVSLFIHREAFHFYFLRSIQNQVKRLLNLIGWKIQLLCFRWQTGGTVHTLSVTFPAISHVSGFERVREIGSLLTGAVRFLLITFPLTIGHNVYGSLFGCPSNFLPLQHSF